MRFFYVHINLHRAKKCVILYKEVIIVKKLTCLILIFILLCPSLAIHAEEKPISVVLNGEKLEFDVPPMLMQDRTMVPLRAIFEALGAEVNYDEPTKKITASLGNTVVTLRVDTPAMYVNGSEHMLDMPATVVDGRTLVPVRAVSEAFNCEVTWDESTHTVLVAGKSKLLIPNNLTITSAKSGSLKAQLHFNTRKTFEEKVFPSLLFENQDTFKSLLKGNKDELLKTIDEELWLLSMDDAVATYLLANDSTFKNLGNKDAIAKIDEQADAYALWPHQNYTIDLFDLNTTDICLIVNLANFENEKQIATPDLTQISSFLVIVYETDVDKLHYFRCLNGNLIERTAKGTETNLSIPCANKSDLLNGLTKHFGFQNPVITPEKASDFPSGSHIAYTAEDAADSPILLFRTNQIVKNVTLYSITSNETAYDTRKPLYYFSTIGTNKPFAAKVVFYGDLHTYGISFTDSKGSKRFFVLETSFKDGSMQMQEIFGF